MAWWMYLLLFIYAVACVILIGVILLQSGKGGGLSSLGASSQGLSEALGATGAERTLMRLTTYAAVTFIVLSLVIALLSSRAMHHTTAIIGNAPAATAPAVPGASEAVPAPPGVPQEAPGVPPNAPVVPGGPVNNPGAAPAN